MDYDFPGDSSGAFDAGGAFEIGGGVLNFGQDYTDGLIRELFTIAPNLGNALELLAEQLGKMPLEALKGFESLLDGVLPGDFDSVGSAVTKIMSVLTENPLFTTLSQFTDFTSIVNQIMDILNGLLVTPINDAVQGIKDWWDSIGNRFDSTNGNHTTLLDGLWSGLQRTSGATGKSSADVGNAATVSSTQAATAVQIAEWNNAVLSLRNNKSLFQGVDETEESNFSLDQLWAGVSSSPAATISATAASVPVAYWRASEVAKKGFISWFGKDFASITDLFLDIYRADYVGAEWDHIHTSPDLISLVSGSWAYLTYSIASIVDRIDVVSGDVLGVAWRVVGAGTHSIAGIPMTGMPAHPTIHPKSPASTRTSVGTLAFTSTTYSTNIPWFGIGIISGDAPPPYYAPRTTPFAASGTYTIPAEFRVAGNLIDLVGIGAGAGGDGSIAYVPGASGLPGTWADATLVYGTDIPLGTTSLDVVIGAGGVGGFGGFGGNGGDGGVCTVKLSTTTLLSAAGGSGQTFTTGGSAAGEHTYLSTTYQGGATSGIGNAGHPPGGGGGGALPYLAGNNGGTGAVLITVRQP